MPLEEEEIDPSLLKMHGVQLGRRKTEHAANSMPTTGGECAAGPLANQQRHHTMERSGGNNERNRLLHTCVGAECQL